nr:RNA-directed DNA polymerase, eukaryota [Tanacetum cinerariifolium]
MDEVLRKFGFGDKWCNWIQCFLKSLRGSIIVNGSPTEEFQFGKGLKQGDPLSPFLFILTMESLHLSFQRIVDTGMYHGIKLGGDLVNLSHMFYPDDTVFVGQWCESNIITLVHVLEYFCMASGLRINMSKSKIMGVNVDCDKVNRAAVRLGCLVLKTPFILVLLWEGICLGSTLPLGVIRILEALCSHFFNGHETNSKKASWVNWKKALVSKDRGGLGISSLFVMNRGLMFKWVWRFLTQESTLWTRVIKAIHGEDGRIGTTTRGGPKSCWMEDKWCPGGTLKDRYPRVYALESCKHITVGAKLNQPNLSFSFRRNPRGGCEQEQFEKVKELMKETASHLFFPCCMARKEAKLITRWWNVSDEDFDSYDDWVAWLVSIRLPMKNKKMLEEFSMLCGGFYGCSETRLFSRIRRLRRRCSLMM